MLNILTIDLEDYYQVSAFESVVKREDWGKYESRIERNTHRVLEILEEASGEHPSFVPPYAGLRRTSSAERRANEPTPNSSRIAHSAKRTANAPTPCASDVLPQASSLSPEISNLSPSTSHLAPYTPDVSSGVKATFFCLGWIAERYPHLIREIQNQGHEIACHGYDHRLVYDMHPEQFREDIRKSKQILEDIIGEEVLGYRAPSYSITKKSLWAVEVLAEEGYRYDSSIFPIHHDRYGIPDAPRFPFVVDLDNGGHPKFVPLSDDSRSALCSMPYAQNACDHGSTAALCPNTISQSEIRNRQSLLELPISTLRLFGQNIPISGGGYFRFFPYRIAKRALARINHKERQPFMFYLHPWELDEKQPRIELLSLRSKFRHYTNLNQTESKLRRLLKHFAFSSVRDILNRNSGLT